MKSVNYLARIYERPYRRSRPQVEDQILTFIGRCIFEPLDAFAQNPMVEVRKDRGIWSNCQHQGPPTTAVACFLEKFSTTSFKRILGVDESTRKFQPNPAESLAKLSDEDYLVSARDRNNTHPRGTFDYPIIIDPISIGEKDLVAPKREPLIANDIFGGLRLPICRIVAQD